MKKLLWYIEIYMQMAAQYFKARMQYRTDFIVSIIGMLFRDVTGFFGIWVLFHTIPTLAGWSFYEVLFLYAFSLLSLTPLQLFFDKVWDLHGHIDDGTFLKYYFKPLDMMFYYMSGVFDIKGLSQLFFAVVGLWYAAIHLPVHWDLFLIFGFMVVSLSSSLIMISMMLFASIPAFWITNSSAILDLVFNLRDFSRYPLTVFNGFFKFFFTLIIPIGFIAYYPVEGLIRGGGMSLLFWMTPLVGGVLFFLAYRFWNLGVKSYSGTGS